jgi:carbon storage regulator
MLVLSRQRDQTILIGDEIELTVVDIRGDKVRIGINAPAGVAVHRKEVYEAIKSENVEAAQLEDGLPAIEPERVCRSGPGLVAWATRLDSTARPPRGD